MCIICTCTYVHIIIRLFWLLFRRGRGTHAACAIAAGAAALVLEKYPRYTPAEVKQHLINSATDGVINMESLRFIEGNKGPNKLLYVGNRKHTIRLNKYGFNYVLLIYTVESIQVLLTN